MFSQQEITEAIVSQLKLIAPDIGAGLGTPERKIIESVAAQLASQSISLNAVNGALDLESKVGDNLDRFLTMFGYARQTATRATGFVTFKANNPPEQDIVIPANTQLFATLTSPSNTGGAPQSVVYFLTQFQGIIPAHSSPAEVTVPVIAQVAGSTGNVSANSITSFGGSPVFGVTSVTNSLPTKGGIDEENDSEFKVRFQNTVFRNLAGTEDQYLGLIASTPFTTKATIIGPISRYKEYLQIPPVDDTESYEFINASGIPSFYSGNSTVSGTYTTALSVVPNAKYTYTDVPIFVTNGQTGAATVFYREGIDWVMNTEPEEKNRGDSYRFWQAQLPGAENPLSLESPTIFQPNITFLNVFKGATENVQTAKPEQVILFEHAYTSSASRNSVKNNVTNAVDIYVDGSNEVVAQTILPSPGTSTSLAFNEETNSYLYKKNFQRYGQPNVYPTKENLFLPLYNEPVTGLPAQIAVTGVVTSSGTSATSFYDLNTHYWLVEDITDLYGTVRCRNGIEFSTTVRGNLTNENDQTGYRITEYEKGTPIVVNAYDYDQNIVNLQALCESNKQINTDVLVHKARVRYFKLDLVVVYSPGSTSTTVNSLMQTAVAEYFSRQTFGALIQLGSIIQALYNVPGVQNVRWTAELPFGPEKGDHKITETDSAGNPVSESTGRPGFYDEDFYLGDDELPVLPTGRLTTDTLPGMIIRPRAENTFVRGPFNPAVNSNLPIAPD